jgi:phosphoglycerol transferase MdoB-like AlkP superfamily enzyme
MNERLLKPFKGLLEKWVPTKTGQVWLMVFLFLMTVWPFLSLFRLSAFLTYSPGPLPLKEILHAFWMGLRFDAVVLFYLLAPLTLVLTPLHLFNLPWGLKRTSQKNPAFTLKTIQAYLTLGLALVLAILAIDLKYYSYFQDHINILVFGFFDDDTVALIKTFWRNYPVLLYFFAGFALITALWKISGFFLSIGSETSVKTSSTGSLWFARILQVAFVWVFVFVGGRGSFGLFPLGPADTVISKNSFVNYLTTNGVHALYRAIKLKNKQGQTWDANLRYYKYQDHRQAFADYFEKPKEELPTDLVSLFQHRTEKNLWAENTKPHIVVIVMESFGTFWLQYHAKDFNLLGELEQQIPKGVFLKNFLPSTGSTTGSLSSLMIAAPHRPIGNFLTESEYLQVPFRSSPARIYKQKGYKTRFIYGGNPGWRDMNKFARFQGFDTVEGDVDIEEKLGPVKEKHDWGIYDEDLFRYIEVTLDEATEPQMLLVMTTTNHPPYQIPKTFTPPELKLPANLEARLTGDSKSLAIPRFRVFHYSNHELGLLLNRITAKPLGDKTIFAITGDHSFNLVNFLDSETFYKWSVPLLLFAPSASGLKIDNKVFGSHMDIFPTLYHLSFSETEYTSLGKNLNSQSEEKFALHSSGTIANEQDLVLHYAGDNFSSFQWDHPEWLAQIDFSTPLMVSSQNSPESEKLAKKYRGLMGVLDYFLKSERELSKSSP